MVDLAVDLVAGLAVFFVSAGAATTGSAAARRGRASAAVVSISFPRCVVTVSGTVGRVDVFAGVLAVAAFFFGGMVAIAEHATGFGVMRRAWSDIVDVLIVVAR